MRARPKALALLAAAAFAGCSSGGGGGLPRPELTCAGAAGAEWPQWSRAPAHGGTTCAAGQPLDAILFQTPVDESFDALLAEAGGDLLVHYQTPLLVGDGVLVAHKRGPYPSCSPPGSGGPAPCGPDAWDAQTWSEVAYRWQGGALAEAWSFDSDWKPPPNGPTLGGWEPVFHAAVVGGDRSLVAIPGAGGTLHLVARANGDLSRTVNPFGPGAPDPSAFVAGPITADAAGNAWYTVVRLDPVDPWGDSGADAEGFLVRVAPDGTAAFETFAALVPGAPPPEDRCEAAFAPAQGLPFPPVDSGGDFLPTPTVRCGAQRPQVNAAPAIGADGTVYFVSRAHRSSRTGFLVAATPALAPRWAASLRGRLADGCGVLVPYGTDPASCRTGAARGVDPATNTPPAGQVVDQSTSSPVALPGGGVVYGTFTRYNGSRGHLFRFDAAGAFTGSYDFGWDVTPAVFAHGGSYSVVLKDNHYATGGPYRLTQLDASLRVEWTFESAERRTCAREPDGSVSCTTDPANAGGFEWCVNAVAVDRDGVVYANSEDGNLYAIGPGGVERGRIFLDRALGAAYTPISLDAAGRLYAQNAGRLYVVGRR